MRDEVFCDEVKDQIKTVFEDCNIHSWEETKDIYREEFGTDISEDFKITDEEAKAEAMVLQSGSIGQVYKLHSKAHGFDVAVKVKHPRIDKKVDTFVRLVSAIMYLMSWFVKIPYIYLVKEFIGNVNLQLDFIKEAHNTRRLKECYKDESCIVIPQILDCSNRIIVMTYHEGRSLSSIEDKQLVFQVSTQFYFFVIMSLIIHDFFHCDLHDGNCKVDDQNRLVIYDCGIIGSVGDLALSRVIMESMIGARFDKLVEIATHPSEKHDEDFNQFVIQTQSDLSISTAERFRIIFNSLLKSGKKTNSQIMRVMQGIIIGEKNIIKCVDKCSLILGPESNIVVWLYSYIHICNAIGKFKPLCNYFRAWLSEYANSIEELRSWIDEKFGHRDEDVFFEVISEALGIAYTKYDYFPMEMR
jgi:predicted Ser/Thr protein kinase